MKHRSRFLRVILIGLAVIVLAIPILLFLATLPPGEHVIKGILESQLTSQLHQGVSIGTFETNLLSRVQILHLRVADARPGRHTAALEVGAVRVHYDLGQLLHHVLAVRSVEIDSVRISVERSRNRRFNIALLDSASRPGKTEKQKARDTSGSSWKVRLGEFALNGLHVDYRDMSLPASATIDGMRASVRGGKRKDSYDIMLNSGTGTVQYGKFPSADLNVRLKAAYSEAGITLDSLLVRTSDLLLRAEGKIPARETAPIEASVHLSGSPQQLYAEFRKPLNLPPLTLTGDVAIAANIAGTRRRPAARVRMDLPAVNVRRVGLSRSLVAARWNGDSLAVDTLRVRVFNGQIVGSTHLALGKKMEGTGAFAVRGLSLASLYSTLRDTMSPYVGEINGDISTVITGKDPMGWNFASGFTVSRFAHLSDSLADIHLSANLNRGQAHLSLTQEKIDLRAEVSMLPKGGLSGNYSLKVPDVAAIGALVLQGEKVNGTLDLAGTIGGTMRSPVIKASLRGDNITYRNFPLDHMDAEVSYDSKHIFVSGAHLSGNLTVDPKNPPFGLDSLQGAIAYSGEARGPVDMLQGRFVVRLDHPAYKGVRVDSASLQATTNGREISLTRMDIHRDSLALSVEGSYNIDSSAGALTADVLSGSGPYQTGTSGAPNAGRIQASFAVPAAEPMQISASGRELDLRTIASIVLDTARVSGLLDFEMKGGGSPSNPSGTFHLSLREPQYDSLSLDSITSSVTLREGKIDIHAFDIYGPQQRLTANAVAQMQKDSTGKFALLGTSPIEGKVEANRFNLHSAEAVLHKGAKLSGTASLNLRWNGTVDKPNATGSFDIDSLHLLLNPSLGPVALTLHGSIRGPAVQIDSSSGVLLNQPFSMKGSIEAEDWKKFTADIGLTVADSSHLVAKGSISSDRLDLTAEVQRLNLALAQPFISSLTELSGMLDSRVTLKGSMNNPSTSGFLAVRALRFHPAMLDSAFRDGVIKVNFTGNTVHLDTMLVKAQYGTVFASGDLVLGQGTISSANLSTIIRHLPLTSEDNFTARIDSAGIVFKGQTGAYTLGGDIILGESRLTKDFDLTSFIGKQSVHRVPEQKPGVLQQTKLNLRIRGSDSLWVDNNLADLRMHVELGIIGRPSNPIPTGLVSIPEGKIFYLDRDFQVTQGTFLFSDPNKINPEIHLTAKSDVTSYQGMNASTYTITFSAQGLLSELETNLSSTPPLDNSDIVALLTLGTTRSGMTQGGSSGGTGTVLENRAEVLASERLSGALAKKAGKALGLDSVSVTGNLFNFNDSWGPQLVIAKRISPRTKITYSTNVGHINEQSFRIDYQLTKTLSLEGETDDRGNAIFSIIYGLKFP